MNITFEELRRIKHALPAGSIAKIAQELNLDPGPNGGIVHIEDTTILKRAQQILSELESNN
jgi:HJR/Mrr/RecB family endonuclease